MREGDAVIEKRRRRREINLLRGEKGRNLDERKNRKGEKIMKMGRKCEMEGKVNIIESRIGGRRVSMQLLEVLNRILSLSLNFFFFL